MSENPYQPSQVAQGFSGQSIGLRRIVAIAAVNFTYLVNWRFYGFRLHAVIWLLCPLIFLWFMLSPYSISWVSADRDDYLWRILAIQAPWFLFLILVTWKSGVILSTRSGEPTPLQNGENNDGVLYASGGFTLQENAANYNHILRFINRLISGRGPMHWFIRIPCKIRQTEFAFSHRTNPFDDEPETAPDKENEYWYAAGKLDPQKQPELVYQHLGFNSDPAVKIYYIDEQKRSMWLVLASPDAGYLQQTLASMPQSFIITLGN